MKRYVYFFTRQDISPEQQIVQTAHAALKLGVSCANLSETKVDPDATHFIVVGVRNLEALRSVMVILCQFDYDFVSFFEPDMNDEMTSIATVPITENMRGVLLAFNLLRV